MRTFGLIGYPLGHSFSKRYFAEKFSAEGISDARYELFPLEDIQEFPALLTRNPELRGLNVTIPHKQQVIPYLDELDETAARIGAVNVIKFADGKIIGYNSDYQGFMQALQHFYPCYSPSQALILGSGGASKAVQLVLEQLNIPFRVVARNPEAGQLHYSELSAEIMNSCALIVNTTPLGTFPHLDSCPPIPYEYLSSHHYLFDLVYNPEETLFMRKGLAKGAKVKNGYEMLCLQAEVAWQIWQGCQQAGAAFTD